MRTSEVKILLIITQLVSDTARTGTQYGMTLNVVVTAAMGHVSFRSLIL